MQRVVSLLPSATEILACFGGEALLVGRSHECDYPPGLESLPALTAQRTVATTSADIDAQVRAALEHGSSLYTLDTDRLAALAPDVILTQDLCRVCSIDLDTVRAVAARLDPQPQVVSLNPASLADVLADVLRVGAAVGLPDAARSAHARLRARVTACAATSAAHATARPNVAFLEWLDPLFVGGHWTPELIALAGGDHPLNPAGARSVQIPPEALVASDPDAIVLGPCGMDLDATLRELPALRAQPWWPALRAVQAGRVAVVDGSAMFNRPGPRLVDALEWLTAWLAGASPPPDFPAIPLPA